VHFVPFTVKEHPLKDFENSHYFPPSPFLLRHWTIRPLETHLRGRTLRVVCLTSGKSFSSSPFLSFFSFCVGRAVLTYALPFTFDWVSPLGFHSSGTLHFFCCAPLQFLSGLWSVPQHIAFCCRSPPRSLFPFFSGPLCWVVFDPRNRTISSPIEALGTPVFYPLLLTPLFLTPEECDILRYRYFSPGFFGAVPPKGISCNFSHFFSPPFVFFFLLLSGFFSPRTCSSVPLMQFFGCLNSFFSLLRYSVYAFPQLPSFFLRPYFSDPNIPLEFQQIRCLSTTNSPLFC